jgi:4-hydroxy-tetrahydrodipicolinate synthase
MNRPSDQFRGTGVAIVTPFLPSEAIDFESFGNLIDYVIKGNIDYIVVMGTTGESPTLDKKEKKALVEFAVGKIDGRVPLVIGVGGNHTSEVVLNIHAMPLKGVAGILSVAPYYNKPTQEGLYRHYSAVAEASPVPVILYTVPGRTGSNIAPETTLRLASDFANIVGIKEASGDFDQFYKVLKQRPEGFLVLSGDDALTLPMMATGFDGVISVVANAYPDAFSTMVRMCMAGDFPMARQIHFGLIDLMDALFANGSPGGIKAALHAKGLCQNILRLPLVPVNPETKKRIEACINKIEQP